MGVRWSTYTASANSILGNVVFTVVMYLYDCVENIVRDLREREGSEDSKESEDTGTEMKMLLQSHLKDNFGENITRGWD